MTLKCELICVHCQLPKAICNDYKIWTQLCALSTLGSKSKSMLTCTFEEMENGHKQHGKHRQLQ